MHAKCEIVQLTVPTLASQTVQFSYIICRTYSVFKATVRRKQSISNIFALQAQTFQHEQQNEHIFTMGEDGEERDAWEG